MKAYTFGSKDITVNSNQVKEVFLEKMVKENKISQELADEMNEYCIVVAEKSYFGKLWDKILWKDEEDHMEIVIVKIIK